MRPCTPILVRTRAAGIRIQVRTASRRARRGAIVNPQAPSHADPRTARRHEGAGARPKAIFSLGPSTARSLFVKNKKRMGGGMSQLAPQLNPPGGRLPPLRPHRTVIYKDPYGSHFFALSP